MPMSPRVALTAGLSLLGLVALVAPTLGQQADSSVQKTSGQTTASRPVVTATLGTVDMSQVLLHYKKAEDNGKKLQAEAMNKRKQLMDLAKQGEDMVAQREKLVHGTPAYQKLDDEITRVKAQIEAIKEQSSRDLDMKQAEMTASLYKEIQGMVKAVARQRGMTLVIAAFREDVSANNVMAAAQHQVVYADERADITEDVIAYLNKWYERTSGDAAKAAATTSAK